MNGNFGAMSMDSWLLVLTAGKYLEFAGSLRGSKSWTQRIAKMKCSDDYWEKTHYIDPFGRLRRLNSSRIEHRTKEDDLVGEVCRLLLKSPAFLKYFPVNHKKPQSMPELEAGHWGDWLGILRTKRGLKA
jgi:hypothetical protein